MSRIEADHLAREAIVYVRQSTIDQVIQQRREPSTAIWTGRASPTAWLGQRQCH